MKLTGDPQTINADQATVFEFLSDFNNFEKLMPEQISEWSSDKESCTFTIQGITTITLTYSSKQPNHTIEIKPVGKTPVSFNLLMKLFESEKEVNKTTGIVEIDADLNPMMAMIARRPLENLVNVMAEKLNEVFI
jgi:carbon monoxide dehydrogenase subunit G